VVTVVDSVEHVWRQNFADSARAIPSSWVLTDEDGLTWIYPEYADRAAARLHRDLALVGYAKGWMP
jgi:hypothetical protein